MSTMSTIGFLMELQKKGVKLFITKEGFDVIQQTVSQYSQVQEVVEITASQAG